MQQERRLAAILVADVVGFARLVGADESGTLSRLAALRREVIDPLIAGHGGRVFKQTGDGFLVEFASAVQAVTCARAIQAKIDGGALSLRIGIHLGDVVVQGDDLMGDGVNVAARIEGVAEPGGIAISRQVHDQVRDRLAVAFDDKGEIALKNIARPVQVFAVTGASPKEATPALALPDKPSIAVLPFQNMSGDPEQEYFVDGIVEDIITELSRFKSLFVIARNSTFTYRGKAVDVRTVARELGVRYVLEGSIRKAGDRARITAQLIDAAAGSHLWAERYDRTLEDVFAVQEDVTRSIVMAVVPGVEMAEVALARHAGRTGDAAQLAWRALGLFHDALKKGQASGLLEAIAATHQALAVDPASLSVLDCLVMEYWFCHLYRWGPEPEKALDAAWSMAERMLAVQPRDFLTLKCCGLVRVARGERERGIADLRRALALNPNSSNTLVILAFAEATAGQVQEAKAHALMAIRLSPRDTWVGAAQLALAMACFTSREYGEAVRWAELAIQSDPVAPIRRAIMIACCARAGDVERAAQERATLDGFAPQFVASLFRGKNRIFTRAEDMEHLLDGLRLAGCEPE